MNFKLYKNIVMVFYFISNIEQILIDNIYIYAMIQNWWCLAFQWLTLSRWLKDVILEVGDIFISIRISAKGWIYANVTIKWGDEQPTYYFIDGLGFTFYLHSILIDLFCLYCSFCFIVWFFIRQTVVGKTICKIGYLRLCAETRKIIIIINK